MRRLNAISKSLWNLRAIQNMTHCNFIFNNNIAEVTDIKISNNYIIKTAL